MLRADEQALSHQPTAAGAAAAMAAGAADEMMSLRMVSSSGCGRVPVRKDSRFPFLAASAEGGTSASYFTASCGDAPLNIIRQHIERQKHPAQATPGLTPP
jgi:hypothetical protein